MVLLRRWWRGLPPGDRRLAALFVVAIAATLPGYALAAAVLLAGSSPPAEPLAAVDLLPDPTPTPTSLVETPSPTPTAGPLPLADVVARGLSSTVVVAVVTARGVGNGTGVAIGEGRIITNAHVVEEARVVRVRGPSGGIWEAEVLGLDSTRDLALLQVEARDLVPAVLGDSARLALLEEVVAIGFPLLDRFEDGVATATRGAVNKLFVRIGGLDFIQTDATLNPGNSGGPLLNRRGEVVGINVARVDRAGGRPVTGVNLAIPIDDVKTRLERLASGGRPTGPAAAGPPPRRARPQEAVERYYRLVAARDYRAAYDGFTRAFQQRHPYEEFAGWFKDKQGVAFQRARAEATGRDASIIEADIVASDRLDGRVVIQPYREHWRVVWERDAWRIDDLLETRALATPTPQPSATRAPTRQPPPPTPLPPTATLTPAAQAPAPPRAPSGERREATPARSPTPTSTPEPRCQSLPGSHVPGRHFDVVQASTHTAASGELVVEGVVRNNCDRPLRAVIRAEALDARGQPLATGQTEVGQLRRDERASFQISLGRVQGVAQARVVAEAQ